MTSPTDIPHLCPECGTPYCSARAAEECCRD
jgi:hypothetical protein